MNAGNTGYLRIIFKVISMKQLLSYALEFTVRIKIKHLVHWQNNKAKGKILYCHIVNEVIVP